MKRINLSLTRRKLSRELSAIWLIAGAICVHLATALLIGALTVENIRAQAADNNPVIQCVSVREVSVAKSVVSFTLEISGNNFGAAPADLKAVTFLDAKGAAVGTIHSIALASNNQIVVQAEAPLGTTINLIRITTKGITTDSGDFKLTLKEPAPAPAVKHFEIKFSTVSSASSPIQTLSITNDQGLFSPHPHQMSVEILPAGASNVLIRAGSNQYNLIVDFIAPQNFTVKDVIVTVYDSSDLDTRQPIAASQPPQEKKPQADPNQPTITNVEVLYLQRNDGIGRLKIEGSGFGNYPPPPISADDFLAKFGWRSIYPTPSTSPSPTPLPSSSASSANWQEWNSKIEQSVNLVLKPRNETMRVLHSKILYIDDKLIDLYFEYTNAKGYSLSFKPDNVALSVKKPGAAQLQVLKSAGVEATITGPETYLVSQDIGPSRNSNLTYDFTILPFDKANYEFGRGIAENFYVVKLSVVNLGEKKVSIPLAAIQAEVDWAYGSYKEGKAANQEGETDSKEYLDGPDTQSPAPLEDVSAYFSAYQKLYGKKPKLFNVLDGTTTLLTSLIPLFGPGFKDAQVIFTGGLIPGLRQGLGDLSAQQLQNITARAWQNVEIIPDHGGSLIKYIFIPRGEQVFNGDVKPHVRKLIMNMRGIEVNGFEVTDSTATQATPKPSGETPQ